MEATETTEITEKNSCRPILGELIDLGGFGLSEIAKILK
jgi:hypothetical protein